MGQVPQFRNIVRIGCREPAQFPIRALTTQRKQSVPRASRPPVANWPNARTKAGGTPAVHLPTLWGDLASRPTMRCGDPPGRQAIQRKALLGRPAMWERSEKGLCTALPTGAASMTAQQWRTHDALMTHEWRRNGAQMTRFWRAIIQLCARHFAQCFGGYINASKVFPLAAPAKDAAVQATPLIKLFRLYAKGSQTLCKERSIMRQNVSKYDCLPCWCVFHNILALWHLPLSQMFNTKEKCYAHLKDCAVAQVGNLRHRLTSGPEWGGFNPLKELEAAERGQQVRRRQISFGVRRQPAVSTGARAMNHGELLRISQQSGWCFVLCHGMRWGSEAEGRLTMMRALDPEQVR